MLSRCVLLAVVVAASGSACLRDQRSRPIRIETPAVPGQGGTLVVVAPETLCAADLELMVTRITMTGGRYVFQSPVAPPECEWTIRDVWPGEYQVVLKKARGDQRITAISRFDVHAGSTWTTTMSPLAATAEGLITIDGTPVGSGTHVEVIQCGGPAGGGSWETRTDDDGHYRVAVEPHNNTSVRLRFPQALNVITSKCGLIGPGSNRKDFDLPPGRIIVTFVPPDGPIYETPILVVLSTPGAAISNGVTVTGRIERQFVGLKFGKQHVRATTMDYERDFDTAEVVLSPDEPVKRVTLSVPYSR